MTATATKKKSVKKVTKTVVKKVNPAERARSSVVRAVYSVLDRKRWTSIDRLVEAASAEIPAAEAVKVFDFRIGRGRPFPRAVKIARGKRMKVLLDCITLVRTGKIEQRGKGDTKEYRLL